MGNTLLKLARLEVECALLIQLAAKQNHSCCKSLWIVFYNAILIFYISIISERS